MMTSPTLASDKDSIIKLEWDKCPGNKSDTRYILKWDAGDESLK